MLAHGSSWKGVISYELNFFYIYTKLTSINADQGLEILQRL